jgi:hypothetical protein
MIGIGGGQRQALSGRFVVSGSVTEVAERSDFFNPQ